MTLRTFGVDLTTANSSSPDSEFGKIKFETESLDPMVIELQALDLTRHAPTMRRALEAIVKLSPLPVHGENYSGQGAEILTIALAALQLVNGEEDPQEQEKTDGE